MKLMTFNILLGGIDEHGSRIDFMKEVIKEAAPDFLAMHYIGYRRESPLRLLLFHWEGSKCQIRTPSPTPLRLGP